jgi:hypothetical protein
MNRPPIRSGNPMIDACFDLCVDILLWLADLFGVSYNTINIWIFCIIWPIFTLVLMILVVKQYLKIRKLKQELKEK